MPNSSSRISQFNRNIIIALFAYFYLPYHAPDKCHVCNIATSFTGRCCSLQSYQFLYILVSTVYR